MISNFTFSKALVAFFLVALVGCGGGNNIPPDADGDGIEDSLDAFPNDPTESTDGDDDGVGDNGDNCPAIANSDQVDTDLDGTGDACDDDKDADSVLNDADNKLPKNHPVKLEVTNPQGKLVYKKVTANNVNNFYKFVLIRVKSVRGGRLKSFFGSLWRCLCAQVHTSIH